MHHVMVRRGCPPRAVHHSVGHKFSLWCCLGVGTIPGALLLFPPVSLEFLDVPSILSMTCLMFVVVVLSINLLPVWCHVLLQRVVPFSVSKVEAA